MMNQDGVHLGVGAQGFSKQYWDENYYDLSLMEFTFNARQHAVALRELFSLEDIHVNTMIDFGFGLGHLLREMTIAFQPFIVVGVEPSEYPFQVVKDEAVLDNLANADVHLFQTDMHSWLHKEHPPLEAPLDLGICSGVFQYLSDDEIASVVPQLAHWVKYLYFTVDTDLLYQYQEEELDYVDRFATQRSQQQYYEMITPYFTAVSSRLLESKTYFNTQNTQFKELFFRF
ncbi:MAG: class I SAM-dependent methyltransferase [Chloroflexota bacterium]